ncbi:isochorismatase family protein [Halocynthiibacter sp. C4]|uniref:isochorismatase family protein n=1 Tax=Halocynthiibacter sp. C4 TaxID=2992758 RepID=UPI00237B3299|nr:isochorismatase family protein [Halocynthiibacter sp. C4]MDE0588543.1 isochorismatase family protein [Halocynthiibacter sp. C4]
MPTDLMSRDTSFLVVVDLQERLAPAIAEFDRVLASAMALVQAAEVMGVPVIFTEHCAAKVGPTVPTLLEAAPNAPVLHKTHFGTLEEAEHQKTFAEFSGRRPIVCGTETHVCVLQTLFGFLQHGFSPLLATDACGSRREADKATGIARMVNAGAEAVTTEMVIFEWLRRADNDLFRKVHPIIKAL